MLWISRRGDSILLLLVVLADGQCCRFFGRTGCQQVSNCQVRPGRIYYTMYIIGVTLKPWIKLDHTDFSSVGGEVPRRDAANYQSSNSWKLLPVRWGTRKRCGSTSQRAHQLWQLCINSTTGTKRKISRKTRRIRWHFPDRKRKYQYSRYGKDNFRLEFVFCMERM